MEEEKNYALAFTEQELRDLTDAAMVTQDSNADCIKRLIREGFFGGASQLRGMNERLAELVRRMQQVQKL